MTYRHGEDWLSLTMLNVEAVMRKYGCVPKFPPRPVAAEIELNGNCETSSAEVRRKRISLRLVRSLRRALTVFLSRVDTRKEARV